MRIRSLILPALFALAFCCQPAVAQNKANDVDITVTLATDGSAQIREVWDMTLSRGTEVYLLFENLGDIRILDLTVSDELGETYTTDRHWDTERSFERKKNHCGLNTTSRGYEICWGIGEYGHRTYTLNYTLTNLVKSLQDYDMIHFQFFTPKDFRTERVRVTLRKPGFEMDTLTRIWAFGFDGYIWREDGKVIAESENPLEPGHSVIILTRFDKGTFESESRQNRSFQTVLDKALEGADDPDSEEDRKEAFIEKLMGILFTLCMVLLPFLPLVIRCVQRRSAKKNAFGTTRLADIPWSRELPYDGDILKNYYVISTTPDLNAKKNSVASAMILRMLQHDCLLATRDGDGKVLISFNDKADFTKLDPTEEKLWSMMYEASGANHILEEKEFSSWAKYHSSQLIKWTTEVKNSGLKGLLRGQFYRGGKYTETGRQENLKLIGFKKFLEDATLIKERTSPEVTLWREYLVFASLIGIADKVAKELKDINPVLFEQACTMAYTDMTRFIRLSDSYTNVLTRYSTPASTYTGGGSLGGFSRSGGGGHTSFGGGGGFSGGGHGGIR